MTIVAFFLGCGVGAGLVVGLQILFAGLRSNEIDIDWREYHDR